jgi:hypothetical protein
MAAAAAIGACVCAGEAQAQEEHVHEDGSTHLHEGLHFTHPLIAESITPDTKLRVDYQWLDFPDGDTESSTVLEAEYAFHRSFSIELGLPYSASASEFGNLEAVLKFAYYAFEDAGILLGYGVELGFPTNGTPAGHDEDDELAASRQPKGDGTALTRARPRFNSGGGGGGVEGTLGTDDWELAPFLNFGLKRGRFELVAWGILGIPFGGSTPDAGPGTAASIARSSSEGDEEVVEEGEGVELSYSLSALYGFSSRVQGVLELDAAGGIMGEAVGQDVLNLAPGLRFQLFPSQPLVLGVSAGFPLANEEFFDTRIKASLFWHF